VWLDDVVCCQPPLKKLALQPFPSGEIDLHDCRSGLIKCVLVSKYNNRGRVRPETQAECLMSRYEFWYLFHAATLDLMPIMNVLAQTASATETILEQLSQWQPFLNGLNMLAIPCILVSQRPS
jgi:hypothetical protein